MIDRLFGFLRTVPKHWIKLAFSSEICLEFYELYVFFLHANIVCEWANSGTKRAGSANGILRAFVNLSNLRHVIRGRHFNSFCYYYLFVVSMEVYVSSRIAFRMKRNTL